MDFHNTDDSVTRRVRAFTDRVARLKAEDLYYLNMPVAEILPGMKVRVNGREMGMYASYSYLGLVGHPRINEAAKKAVDKYGTGTNGVRMLAGTLTLHKELEETIAHFKHAEAAVTYSSGYVTNLTVISGLMGRGDYIFSDKLNHASIVDGCLMSGAEFRRFRHNDMAHLEGLLRLVHPHRKQSIEAFRHGGRLEPLPRGEDGHVGHPLATPARAVAPQRVTRLGDEEIADHLGAMLPRDRDQRRPHRHAGIGVVHHHRSAGCERLGDELLLPPLRLPVVAKQVLADVIVRARKPFAEEGGLARGRQADQDHALHVQIVI